MMVMRIGVLCLVVWAVTVLGQAVWAQDATLSPAPANMGELLLELLLKSVVPAVWVAIGPLTVAAITKGVNAMAGAYVPRSVQVILSGLTTAVAAGLTGDASGVAQAVGTGMGSQMLATTKPETLLTSEREPVMPASQSGLVRSWLPLFLVLAFVGLTACKSGDGAKFSQKLVTLSKNFSSYLVEGCDATPGIYVAYDTLAPLLSLDEKTKDKIELYQDKADEVCAKVKAGQS